MESPIPDAARGVLCGRSYSFIYLSFSDRQVPTWFRWRKSGRKTESDSGGDGLLATPRSRPTPLSDVRTPTSESVGWLLLLFAIEKQRKKFFMYFWGQKYQKPPHVVFRGSVRAAALHGARKIKPMRHPVTDAPQPAPSFSASNESADLLCRQRRHYFIWQRTSISITSSFPARRVPTWFRWRKSGRKAESDSGGDGLLANPRSRPTPLSVLRTPTSESVGWLLLLFDTEKQRKRKNFVVF